MTTLQEAAKRAIGHLMDRQRSLSSDSNTRLHAKKVIDDLRTALAQQGEQAKPAAYITDTHQGPMVWTPEMYGEACMYCDDDEFPVPLYTAAPSPQAQEPHGTQQLRERTANAEPANSYDLAKRADNRFFNLREATPSLNAENRHIDILPSLSRRLPLARKGRGFLLRDAHVRAREYSLQRSHHGR